MVPHKSCFKEEITGAKVINPKKLSWVRVPVKMVYVAKKLNTTEKKAPSPKLSVTARRLQHRPQP
jgi:hypothetical protein